MDPNKDSIDPATIDAGSTSPPAIETRTFGSVHPDTMNLARVIIESDNSLEIKEALFRQLRKMSPLHDRSLYMTVVVILGLVVLITIVWGFALMTFVKGSENLPAGLIALGSTALGALAGLLAPSPQGQ